MRLRVVHHLHAMFDGAQQPISIAQLPRVSAIQAIRLDQGGDRVERPRHSHRGVAPAVDHLLDLDEELDLATSAAPALENETLPDMRALREMIAAPGRDLAAPL